MLYKSNSKATDSSVPKSSIYIHAKYDDVIAFLIELESTNPLHRDSKVAEVALRHGININQAEQIYRKSEVIFEDDRLMLSPPRGKSNQNILVKAYQISIDDPEELRDFVKIFSRACHQLSQTTQETR